MDMVSFDTFLLLVLLVLVGVILFLSLVTAIYVIRLSQRVTGSRIPDGSSAGSVTVVTPSAQESEIESITRVAPPSAQAPVAIEFDVSRDAPDIPTGMKYLCRLYGLHSLTVSSSDGLVIASDGNPSAVSDAAQFSYAFQTGETINEEGVQVFGFDFRATPLVGIVRSQGIIKDSALNSLQKDLLLILQRWI